MDGVVKPLSSLFGDLMKASFAGDTNTKWYCTGGQLASGGILSAQVNEGCTTCGGKPFCRVGTDIWRCTGGDNSQPNHGPADGTGCAPRTSPGAGTDTNGGSDRPVVDGLKSLGLDGQSAVFGLGPICTEVDTFVTAGSGQANANATTAAQLTSARTFKANITKVVQLRDAVIGGAGNTPASGDCGARALTTGGQPLTVNSLVNNLGRDLSADGDSGLAKLKAVIDGLGGASGSYNADLVAAAREKIKMAKDEQADIDNKLNQVQDLAKSGGELDTYFGTSAQSPFAADQTKATGWYNQAKQAYGQAATAYGRFAAIRTNVVEPLNNAERTAGVTGTPPQNTYNGTVDGVGSVYVSLNTVYTKVQAVTGDNVRTADGQQFTTLTNAAKAASPEISAAASAMANGPANAAGQTVSSRLTAAYTAMEPMRTGLQNFAPAAPASGETGVAKPQPPAEVNTAVAGMVQQQQQSITAIQGAARTALGQTTAPTTTATTPPPQAPAPQAPAQ
jgi:hypothetical protein